MFSGLTPRITAPSQSTPPYAGSYQRPSPSSDEEVTTLVLDHIRNANDTLNFQVIPHTPPSIRRIISSLMPQIVVEIRKKPELQILNFYGLGLTASAITPLIYFLVTNPPVHTLNFSHNSLDDEGAALIGVLLSQNSVLENLTLIQCEIGTKGFLNIAAALKYNTTLTGLIYHNAPRMERTADAALTEIVALNTTLTSLECGFTLEKPRLLIEALLKNSTLTNFKLVQFQLIFEEGLQNLAEVIRTTTTLKQLTFKVENMPAEGFTSIAAALSCNSSLRSLDLGSSLTSNLPAQGVIDILTNNSSLEEIDLSSRVIGGSSKYTLPEQTQIVELYSTHPSLIKLGLDIGILKMDLYKTKLGLDQIKLHNKDQRDITLTDRLIKECLPIINDDSYLQYTRSTS